MVMEILVRGSEGYSIWNGPPFGNGKPETKLENTPCKTSKFSDDGSRVMVIKSESEISVYDTSSYALLRTFSVPNFSAAALSPRGTYLQTFQEKTAVLWNVLTGEPLYRHPQKSISRSNWPSIRFSSDEDIACRMVTNEIQFFDVGDLSKGFVSRLRVPGIAAFELSSFPASFIAVFVPESKGIPASVQIFKCGKDKEDQQQPVARKSFFRASSVQLKWNRGSTGLLVVVQSDVDKTNQSYYGESKLNYLTTDGSYEGLVPLRKEGPVHDVHWSSSGSQFAVVYGYMPAKATVFDKKCAPLLELGTGPYNTIRWNPKGKFLCLAGFGNLPGDMAFWDYEEKKQLGTTKAELSVTSEWSPDGCYFMTATTAPRLQVDNGIKIFHHNGSLYYKKMFDRLYQADWKPESPNQYGDISELVKAIDTLNVDDAKTQGTAGKAKSSSTNAPPAKPAAYRPPQAKNAAIAMAALFGEGPSETLSKAALKNKKRREKQKEKKATE